MDNRFDWDHVLAGEGNASNKATGYHMESAAGGAATIRPGGQVTKFSNGVYRAPVDVWDATRNTWVEKKCESSFFPASWSRARIEFEMSEAFKLGRVNGPIGAPFQAVSPSGITIQFNWDAKNSRTTFYPLGQ